jgi:hypothetical protein
VVKEVTLMRHKDRSMAKLSSSGKSRSKCIFGSFEQKKELLGQKSHEFLD